MDYEARTYTEANELLETFGDFHDCYIARLVQEFAASRVEIQLDTEGADFAQARPRTIIFDGLEYLNCRIPFVGGAVRINGVELSEANLVDLTLELTTTEWLDSPEFQTIEATIRARSMRVVKCPDYRLPQVTIDLTSIESESELHERLAESLGFPDFYGGNWDAFWDAITGLVQMPRVIILRGWDEFLWRRRDARQLLGALTRAKMSYPQDSADIELIAADGTSIDADSEAARLDAE